MPQVVRGLAALCRRALCVLLCTAVCLWAVGPRSASAQGEDEGPQPESDPGASPDSAGAEEGRTVLDWLGIHPTYTSKVEVNRSILRWDNGLRAGRDIGKLRLESNWTTNMEEDEKRNNFEQRRGKSQNHLEYFLSGFGEWSTGADLDINRNVRRDDFTRTVDNGNRFAWFARTGLPGRLVSSGLGLPEGMLSWDLKGSAGRTEDVDVQVSRSRTGGGATLSRTDSTRAEGSTYGWESRMSVTMGEQVRFDLAGQTTGGRSDSKTDKFNATLPDSAQRQTLTSDNRNRRQLANATLVWSPGAQNRLSISAQHGRGVNPYFSSQVGGTETSTGLDQSINADVKLVPFWGIQFDLKGRTSKSEQLFEVAKSDRRERGKSLSGRIFFKLGPAFGPLRNLESTSDWSRQETRRTVEGNPGYRDRVVSLRQNFRRPLGQKVVLLATGEGRLQQSFYENRRQDRDELRLLADGTLGYRPTTRLDTRVSAQWQRRETINIAGQFSSGNNTSTSYQVGAEVGCQINPSVKVTQKYAMTANYSFYNFNEESNGLVRTTEVRTILQSTIGLKAKLDLDHNYRFRDSGAYTRSEDGGPRRYSKSENEHYQFLTVATRYDFSQSFGLRASQRFEIRSSKNLATRRETRVEKLDFTGGMELNHRFSQDFSVKVQADRSQRTSEDNFWRIDVRLTRTF